MTRVSTSLTLRSSGLFRVLPGIDNEGSAATTIREDAIAALRCLGGSSTESVCQTLVTSRRKLFIVATVAMSARWGEIHMSHSVTTDSSYDMIAREEVSLQRDLPVQKLLLNLTEVSHVLAISRSKLYDLLNSGSLPSVHIGKSRRVRWSDVEIFVSGGDAKPVSFFRSVK